MSRTAKRSLIIFFYLLLFAAVVWVLYLIFKPAPTCNDGKQNQKETGVDCGGPCAPCPEKINASDFEVAESAVIPNPEGTYDLVAKVRNPNDLYGAQDFSVTLSPKDEQGNVIASFEEKSFILPQQEKYIVLVNTSLEKQPASLDVAFGNISWKKFSSYQEPDVSVTNKEYNLITSGVGYSELKGLLKNNSTFDFQDLAVVAVLRDADDKIITVNSTNMQTVLSREEREFRMFWPKSFPGEVSRVEVAVYVNFFENENFVKRYLEPQRFQEQ